MLAGGEAEISDQGEITLSVKATAGDETWGIVQSPFMKEQARTVEFRQHLSLRGDELSYRETTVLDIYGKRVDHVDENTLTRQP